MKTSDLLRPEMTRYTTAESAMLFAECLKMVLEREQTSISGKWLDVACGNAILTREMHSMMPNVAYFGVTSEKCALQIAPYARFAEGLAQNLPFRSESFNLVTAMQLMDYAEEIVLRDGERVWANMPATFRLTEFLHEAHRVLAPNGMIAICDIGVRELFPGYVWQSAKGMFDEVKVYTPDIMIMFRKK